MELSVQQGVWATQRSNEAKLNEAFDSMENVILIFSVNRTRHFQGCAKMTSRIGGATKGGNWKHEHGTAHYGRNFSVKWLKLSLFSDFITHMCAILISLMQLCELSFQKTRHLRNPYNENLPVKISRDCQELEASVGEQLASLLYLEPDSELMVQNAFRSFLIPSCKVSFLLEVENMSILHFSLSENWSRWYSILCHLFCNLALKNKKDETVWHG
nr:30-kDa cleavage and polyadenylation specificity factor 30-like [Ipomoea batatas]